MSVVALVEPRICWVPEPADASLVERAVEFAREHGGTLDPEQELMLRSMLGVRADGRWQTREVGFNLPRQNGKDEVLVWRELFGLYELGERLVIHTAHEAKTAFTHFERVEAVIRADRELFAGLKRNRRGDVAIRYANGEWTIALENGRIEFKTRTKSGMRGFAGVDFLVLNEAMIIQEAGLNSALPIIRASKSERGPQICFAGSAVDQETHEHGIVWTRVRERGVSGGDDALAYLEWSLPFDHPDEVPDEVADDPEVWRQVNFAVVHGRVAVEHMEWERRVLSGRGFKVELLGVGDWPATTDAGSLIDAKAWKAQADPDSCMSDPICLAFDVSPDRSRSSIAAAGARPEDGYHVEVVEDRIGTGWVAARVAELVESQSPGQVVCDAKGPAASLVHDIERLGVQVTLFTADEYAQACGRIVDMVEQRTVWHLGDEVLASAIRGAATRPLLDRWAWARKASGSNISPLVAATLALSAAYTSGSGYIVDIAALMAEDAA